MVLWNVREICLSQIGETPRTPPWLYLHHWVPTIHAANHSKKPNWDVEMWQERILTTIEIGQSDVVARESRVANFARDCLFPSLVSLYHLRWRARTSTPCLAALDDWATNRVHAMYFASLADNTCW